MQSQDDGRLTFVVELDIAVLHLVGETLGLGLDARVEAAEDFRNSSGNDAQTLVALCVDVDVVRAAVDSPIISAGSRAKMPW